MHGRLKVKTTAEQEAEKQKERLIKQTKYTKAMNAVLLKKEKQELDDEGLSLTAQLLMFNPDALSLWNFRRIILLHFKGQNEEDRLKDSFEKELSVTENCLMKNPKSYGAWHHRGWVLQQTTEPPFHEELKLCDQYLEKDERNFHCWDHRRFVVNKSNRCLKEELRFTQGLIDKNFSNYSAWHYRSKLLPLLHPPKSADCPHPIEEDVFIQELEKVVTAVFTDPSDQSPWFFLRWLINKKEESPRLVQVGIVPVSELNIELILVFSQRVPNCEDLELSVSNRTVSFDLLKPFDPDRTIWKLSIEHSSPALTVEVGHKSWFGKSMISLNCQSGASFQWVSKKTPTQISLSTAVMKTLNQVKDNCITLDELDPGNKWVLLTLVDLMSTLDVCLYKENILNYLSQLKSIDPLRINYYRDVCSKVEMESYLMDVLENESSDFQLRNKHLTHLIYPQYLCSFRKIDLGYNELKSMQFVKYFLNCDELVLDGNRLKCVSFPDRLENVSLAHCDISSIAQLSDASKYTRLKSINMQGNVIEKNLLRTILPACITIKN